MTETKIDKDEVKNEPIALPFDETSPEYEDMLKKIETAYKTLPPGWRRGEPGTDEPYAPYIHDEDQKYVWKHPGRNQIEQIMKDAQKQNPEAWSTAGDASDAEEKRWLKKFRKMLKSGVPQAAVEQRARVQGIDPSKIYVDEQEKDVKSENAAKTATNFASSKEKDVLEKAQKMLKSGVPQAAVEQRMRLEGVDPSKLFDNTNETEEAKSSDVQEEKNQVQDDKIFHLTKVGGKDCIEFNSTKSDKKVANETHLAILTKKLVQTIRKRTGNILSINSDTKKKSLLTVEARDIYNALGSFRGIQQARDLYNSTLSSSTLSRAEIMSKQRTFLKYLSSLGIRLPNQASDEKVDIEGLDDLVQTIEQLFKNEIDSFYDIYKIGLYSFDSLPNLYRPGTQVLAKTSFVSGVEMMCEVVWSRLEEGRTLFGFTKSFKVCFQYLFAVGNHFTLCEVVESMEEFQGSRALEDLDFIPVSFLNKNIYEQKKNLFYKRGIMLNKCGTISQFLAYSQGSFFSKSAKAENGVKSQTSSGRVMVDTQGSYEAGHSLSVGYEPMILAIKQKYKEYKNLMRQIRQNTAGSGSSTKDIYEAASDMNTYGDASLILFDRIPEDLLHMTWPAVAGFSFTSKLWGDVLVDGLSDIQFDNHIFDKLVLPDARKRMIKALVSHTNTSFSDIVNGKGEGSVFLLYGPPGVGKTLTAEAISEMLHRPLYSVALGQLGTTPRELETKLDAILELCSKWDAVVLLDEADIFLEKRNSNGSLERNAMVSVMLRLVEYFKGVLFLTSNRVDSLDPAFKTRITLALRYEHLNSPAREKIWSNLLQASGHENSISNGLIDVKSLARYILNGREIKNAIRLSLALAMEDGKDLNQDIIVETVETFCDFNANMNMGDDISFTKSKRGKLGCFNVSSVVSFYGH